MVETKEIRDNKGRFAKGNVSCHTQTQFNRDDWTKYFNNVLNGATPW